jgi:regulator of protease activity HflC (stomatin/prohibitin superfamily)
MTAPEKIRTNAAGNAIVTPHPVWDTDVEYIRADVAQAMVAKAQEDALREAAEVVNRNLGKPAHHAHAAILALIGREDLPKPKKPNLVGTGVQVGLLKKNPGS